MPMLMNDDLQYKNKDELIHPISMTQEKIGEQESKLASQTTC